MRSDVPRDDSDAEDERLTLKARSESLSSGVPPGDPFEGLDCTDPAERRGEESGAGPEHHLTVQTRPPLHRQKTL